MGFLVIVIGFCGCATPPPQKRIITPRQFLFQPDSSLALKRAKDFMIRGSVLQMQELHAEAILEFQLALRYDSSSAILYAIAKNYTLLNKPELALEYARAAQSRDSNEVPVLELLAEILDATGDNEEVAEIYERIMKLEPDNSEHKFALAQIYQDRNPQRSIELFNEILVHEDDEATLWFLSQAYRRTGDYPQYITTLERLYALSTDIRVANVLVQAYIYRESFDMALQLVIRSEFNARPDDFAGLHTSLTEVLLELGDSTLRRCISLPQYLDRMDKQFSEDWQFYFANGMLASRIEDSSLAETFFGKALQSDISEGELPLRLGGFYLQQGKFSSVISVLRKFEREFPLEVRYPLYIGIAYTSTGMYIDALPYLRKALLIDSSNFDCWTQIGIVYDHLHFADSSDAAYEKALRINSASALVNNNYAYSLSMRQTNLQRALTMAEKAVLAQPLNPSFLDTYAWVHYQLGNYDTAMAYLQKAVEFSDPSATILEHLGDTYSKLGIEQKAYEAYNNALRKSPERSSIIERLQKLSK